MLLDSLTDDDYDAIVGDLTPTPLSLRETICEAGQTVENVYFPVDSVISVITVMSDGSTIETESVGNEGMTGGHVALGVPYTSGKWFVQVNGTGLRMPTATFLAHYEALPSLRRVHGLYVGALLEVLAQYVACNRLHLVTERCARWLLATDDRVAGPEFPLTHETLATMLGVRRAGVSIAAATLQNAGFISYARGRFMIKNREGLESVACECYRVTKNAYERVRQN